MNVAENNLIATHDLGDQARHVFDQLDVKPETRKEYAYRIGLFFEYVRKNDFHYNSFLDFKRYLAVREDFSVATKNKYLATARVFLKELNRRGLIPADITQNVRSFSQSSRHKLEGLNQAEIEGLAAKIHNLPPTAQNARLRALFCLLALQGLRQIEVIRLDVGDLDLANKKAYIQGKGRDDKEYIYLVPETVKTLRAYVRLAKIGSGALFKSLGNRQSERISTITIKREMKKVFTSLGIDKTTHGFRHYYITTLLKQFDVRDVRKFSRHRSLEMLIVYDDELDLAGKAEEVSQCFQGLNVT